MNPGPQQTSGERRGDSRVARNLKLLSKDPGAFIQKVATWVRPMESLYRRRWNRGIRKWMIRYHTQIVFKRVSWMGHPARKMVLDSWVYQDLIYETKPEVIIEIGNKFGGSTLYLAHMLDIMGSGQVIGVDIDHSDFRPRHPRIQLVTGDSSSKETVARVEELTHGKQGLVIHDGDHSTGHVLADLRAYANFVAPGNYFIVEDTVNDLFRAGDGLGNINGPLPAVRRFVQEDRRFEIDMDREYFLITFNPQGFLKRVR
ncbi:MAG TPA: CmcI family methyltransferase [Terriglobia bacterium]|nr:CmcI family methyltransferase [Terriglobia bacterium]